MSKLGPHLINPAADDWCRVAPTVKAFGDVYPLTIADPRAVQIYRPHLNGGQQAGLSPLGALALILDQLRGHRAPHLYVQPLCETQWPVETLVNWFSIFTPAARREGLMTVGPAWSTGAFTEADWTAFRRANWSGLDAIGADCYWGNQGFTPWHALRFTQYWQDGDPPVIVLECGRDAVEGGQGGWRRDGILDSTYAEELLAYDRKLDALPYVIGAAVFTGGPTDEWRPFDIADVVRYLIGPCRVGAGPLIPATPAAPADPAPSSASGPNPSGWHPWATQLVSVWTLDDDVDDLARWCLAHGCQPDIKIADGSSSWVGRRVRVDQIDRLRSFGLEPRAWAYCYSDLRRDAGDRGDGVPEEEADAILGALEALGLDHVSVDYEVEVQGHTDLAAICLERIVRAGTRLSAICWGDASLDGYPWDAIKAYASCYRPMLYDDVWTIPRFYADLSLDSRARVAPIYGTGNLRGDSWYPSDPTLDDMMAARRLGAIGEGYWRYGVIGPLASKVIKARYRV